MIRTNIFILFSLLLTVGASLFSCSEIYDEKVGIDTINISRTMPLSSDRDSPTCKINLSVIYFNKKDTVSSSINRTIERKLFEMQDLGIKQAADSFTTKYTKEYVSYLTPFYKEDRKNGSTQSWYDYRYTLKTEIKYGRSGTIIYIYNEELFEGGAHGIIQRKVMNFDRKTGRLIELKDIFVPGYEKRLNNVLLQGLKNKVGAKDIDELHDSGYLYSMDMFPSGNFMLENAGITFIYNPYEIAPYEKGQTEIFVDYSDIDDLMKK